MTARFYMDRLLLRGRLFQERFIYILFDKKFLTWPKKWILAEVKLDCGSWEVIRGHERSRIIPGRVLFISSSRNSNSILSTPAGRQPFLFPFIHQVNLKTIFNCALIWYTVYLHIFLDAQQLGWVLVSFCTLDHNFQSSCCIGSQLFRLVPPHQKLKIVEINFKVDAWLQCNNKRYWWQCIEMFKVKTGKSALPSLCDSVTRHHKHIRYKCHLRSVKNDSFQNFQIEDEKIWEGLNSDFWARISKMKKSLWLPDSALF